MRPEVVLILLESWRYGEGGEQVKIKERERSALGLAEDGLHVREVEGTKSTRLGVKLPGEEKGKYLWISVECMSASLLVFNDLSTARTYTLHRDVHLLKQLLDPISSHLAVIILILELCKPLLQSLLPANGLDLLGTRLDLGRGGSFGYGIGKRSSNLGFGDAGFGISCIGKGEGELISILPPSQPKSRRRRDTRAPNH